MVPAGSRISEKCGPRSYFSCSRSKESARKFCIGAFPDTDPESYEVKCKKGSDPSPDSLQGSVSTVCCGQLERRVPVHYENPLAARKSAEVFASQTSAPWKSRCPSGHPLLKGKMQEYALQIEDLQELVATASVPKGDVVLQLPFLLVFLCCVSGISRGRRP